MGFFLWFSFVGNSYSQIDLSHILYLLMGKYSKECLLQLLTQILDVAGGDFVYMM